MEKHIFLHCSDLHLGCMPNHLEARYEDFFESFNNLIEHAINEKCEYLLISGDLFHLKVINSKTLLKVITILERAKANNIKIFVIEGNHDKPFFVDEQSWLNFLKERGYIYLLKHKLIDNQLVIDNDSIYEDEHIRIIGIGYLGSATSIYLKNLQNKISKSNKFTVLMLHAAINRLIGEEMGDINIDLLQPLKGIVDYIALGHIHTKYEYDDLCYNPGSIENIRIKDGLKKDKKGYYIVSFDELKQKEVNYYISKQRKINYVTLKIENINLLEDIESYISNYEYNCDENSILELSLIGSIAFNPFLINIEDIKNKIKEKYNLLYIEVNNLINIITNDKSLDNIMDIKAIEKEAISNYISINYPDLNSNDEFIKVIQDLKKALVDEKEYDLIIENLVDKGEIL